MLSRKDLYSLYGKTLAELQDGASTKDYRIRTTSGTSQSEPLFIIRGRRPTAGHRTNFFADLQAPAIFFGSATARLSNIANYLFDRSNAGQGNALVLNAHDLDTRLEATFAEYKPDGLCGFPSFIMQALLLITDQEILRNIKALRLLGEHVSVAHKKVIAQKIPHAEIACFYSAAETGFLTSFPCQYLRLNTYHPARDVKLEIINTDEAGVGEIIVSYPLSSSVWVDRYAIGDMGHFLPEQCPCGNPIAFEVLGRKNFDFVKLLGTILRQEAFDEALSQFSQLITDYRIQVAEIPAETQIKGLITVQIVPKQLPAPETQLRLENELPQKLFLTPTRTMADLVRDNIFLPLKIELVNEFPHQYKAVKMKKLYDSST